MSLKKIEAYLFNFSKKEEKMFQLYIDSPFFNKNKTLSSIVNFLIENKQCIKEKGNETIYSNKLLNSFTEAQLRKIFFNLGDHLENFIFINKINTNNELKKLSILASHCSTKMHHSLYHSYNKKIDSLIKKTEVKDAEFYYYNFLIEDTRQDHFTYFQDDRTENNYLQNALDSLDAFYLIKKMDFLNALEARSKAVSFEHNFRLKQEILSISDSAFSDDKSILKIQKLLYNHQVQTSTDTYHQLINFIEEKHSVFNQSFLNNVLIAILNSLGKIFKGKKLYKEMFKIYNLQISFDLLISNNNLILVSVFKNIVTVALNLSENIWAENFINGYNKYLPADLRNEIYYYSLASLNFEQNNFDLALENINKSFPNDILITLSVKRLYLKIFYELKDYSLLDSSIHSLNMYIRRLKSSSKNHINFHKIFLKHFKALASLKLNPNKTKLDLQNFLAEVSNEPILPEKRWILEKINAEIK